MVDLAHLQDKQVAFRFLNERQAFSGTVRKVESSGFWIECSQMIDQMTADLGWGAAVQNIGAPVIFVPTSSLMYLIAAKE